MEIAREGGVRLQFCRGSRSRRLHLVPPYVPHQEINADPSQPLECVLVRSDNEAVVVNIMDVEPVEKPEDALSAGIWCLDLSRRKSSGLFGRASASADSAMFLVLDAHDVSNRCLTPCRIPSPVSARLHCRDRRSRPRALRAIRAAKVYRITRKRVSFFADI